MFAAGITLTPTPDRRHCWLVVQYIHHCENPVAHSIGLIWWTLWFKKVEDWRPGERIFRIRISMLWGLARGAAIKVLVETGEPVHCSEYEGSWLTSRIGFENCSGHIGGHHLVASIVYENTFLFNLTCTPLEQELINKFFFMPKWARSIAWKLIFRNFL